MTGVAAQSVVTADSTREAAGINLERLETRNLLVMSPAACRTECSADTRVIWAAATMYVVQGYNMKPTINSVGVEVMLHRDLGRANTM